VELGTLITALVIAAFGWALGLASAQLQHRLAVKQLRVQQEANRRAELQRRGREYAEEAIDALRVLRAELPKTSGLRPNQR
jgi:hypothetical protein